MSVHKLLENKLFECELYLGHALMFPDADVRSRAEQNLDGCYKKRILEAARFMWMDGCSQMMRGEWAAAAETLRRAGAKKDGWGWGVNNGDIWIAAAAARMAEASLEGGSGRGCSNSDAAHALSEAAGLLEKARARTS